MVREEEGHEARTEPDWDSFVTLCDYKGSGGVRIRSFRKASIGGLSLSFFGVVYEAEVFRAKRRLSALRGQRRGMRCPTAADTQPPRIFGAGSLTDSAIGGQTEQYMDRQTEPDRRIDRWIDRYVDS